MNNGQYKGKNTYNNNRNSYNNYKNQNSQPNYNSQSNYNSQPNYNSQSNYTNSKSKISYHDKNTNYNDNEYDNPNDNDYDNDYDNDNDYNNHNSKSNDIIDNTNINIKNTILDYLYNKIEINEHKYVLIKSVGDICELKNKKYYISANTCGINSFLIFMKKDNNYYSYLVDRRSISYNRNSLKKSTVRFTEIKLNVDLKLYDGTILDGILIDSENGGIQTKGENKSSKMKFMITDVFNLFGKSLITTNYKKKMYSFMNIFTEYIDNNTNTNKTSTNNIELYISKLYELNQVPNLFEEYIGPNYKKYNIKGLTYYPEFSGTKLIYIFDKQDDKTKNQLFNGQINIDDSTNNTNSTNQDDNLHLLENSNIRKLFRFELMNAECIDDIVLNLEMKKTNISDVYKLYAIFYNKIKNVEKYIKKRIGIAYIPTYYLSIKCKTYFMNVDTKIMTCSFDKYKLKWVPIEEASVQKIDIINNDKRLKIIEEEIIDQDKLVDE